MSEMNGNDNARKKNPASAILNIRITPAQKRKLKAASKAAGISLSQLVLNASLESLK